MAVVFFVMPSKSTVATTATHVNDFVELWNISHGGFGVDWSPDGERIVNTHSQYIEIRNAQDASLIKNIIPDPGTDRGWPRMGPRKVEWSPNGSYIASFCWPEIEESQLYKRLLLMVWDVNTSECVRCFELNGTISDAEWSHDGFSIAVGVGWTSIIDLPNYENCTYIVDVLSGETVRQFPATTSVSSVDWSPDNTKIVVAYYRGAEVWDVSSGESLMKLDVDIPGHDIGGVDRSIADWSPDGEKIAVATYTTIQIWSVETGELLSTIENVHWRSLSKLMWSPDSSLLASTADWIDIRFWNVSTGELVHTINVTHGIDDLSWSPDGKAIVMIGLDDMSVWGIRGIGLEDYFIAITIITIPIGVGVCCVGYIFRDRISKWRRNARI